jgi:hypothetical protein
VLRVTHNGSAEEVTLPPDHQFRNAVDSFAAAVLAGAASTADTGAAILRTMELTDEIRRRAVVAGE